MTKRLTCPRRENADRSSRIARRFVFRRRTRRRSGSAEWALQGHGWVLPEVDPGDEMPLMVGFVADDIGLGNADAAQKPMARERMRVGLDQWAADQLKASKRMFRYYFDRVIPWPAHPEFGAFHSSDVPYVFNTIAKLDRPWTDADRKLADQMSSYWANFAKNGDPNGANLPPWPPFAAAAHVTMELGERSGAIPVSRGPQ